MGTEGTKSDPWTYQCGKCGKLSLIFKSENIDFFSIDRKRLQDQSRARSTHDFLQTRTHTQRKIRNVSSVTPSDNPKDSNSRSKRRRDSCRFVVENDLKKGHRMPKRCDLKMFNLWACKYIHSIHRRPSIRNPDFRVHPKIQSIFPKWESVSNPLWDIWFLRV